MIQLVGQVGIAVRPEPDMGMLGGQVGDGMRVGPVVRVELEGLGGQVLLV